MKDFLLEKQLKKIEEEANDDLHLIAVAGPQHYSNQELYELLSRLDREKRKVLAFQRKLFFTGATSSLWIGACYFSASLGLHRLNLIFLGLIPVTILAFAVGHAFMIRKFKKHSNFSVVDTLIREELNRRRKDASIF